MLKRRLTLTASLAFALMTSACATASAPPVQPPRLPIPSDADRACILPVMVGDTIGGLEEGYLERGRALVECETRRAEALASWRAERELQDRWREEVAPGPPWYWRLLPG